MKMKGLGYLVLSLSLTSCFLEPDKISDSKSRTNKVRIGEKVAPKSVAAKNFLQINNTFSSLTGVSAGDVASEYELVKMQLPSSSNPESLNGFNQIASTRLAFLYCDPYIDGRSDLGSMSNEQASRNLIEGFIDADIEGNSDHQNLYQNVLAIMNDDDSLIDENNQSEKKQKLLKLSCTALLSSSYVTLL